MKIQSSKFKEIFNSSKQYNLCFKNILKSLDLLNKDNSISNVSYRKFSQEEIKNSTEKKHNRFIRNKETRFKTEPIIEQNIFQTTIEKEKDPAKQNLVDNVTKFVLGESTSREFFRILRQDNINPEVEEISKWINSIQNGPTTTDHKNLMMNVLNCKDK